ncbi:hypothetical protein SISNIDRAFT_3049 [Sistotremastrum niveocremeum HHB9708]|uniref:Uncharacterized protein n=1 Tax=Sistotremastrum niveocremeum HHB9708 TaxID=1314777 RepID=A0A165AEI8_9AGAM|nr:hypothetical protein SISNIDRAFT_3049 [Sistotremastrum niveocremeum HHB9708]
MVSSSRRLGPLALLCTWEQASISLLTSSAMSSSSQSGNISQPLRISRDRDQINCQPSLSAAGRREGQYFQNLVKEARALARKKSTNVPNKSRSSRA